MNPRHRRLLIPGLLIALLVVVLVSSLARRADGAEGGPVVVSRLSDPRIQESSGLAVSRRHDDLAYTINDSGNAPIVYAVKVSTGAVVGTTSIAGGVLRDTEAIAIDGEWQLWVGDTGDNRGTRADAALYALPEPGTGDHTVSAKRYPIAYDTGPTDVEALLVDQQSGAMSLVSKGLLGGRLFTLPGTLSTGRSNLATKGAGGLPSLVTDGALTADGHYALLRTYTTVHLYDARTWRLVRSDETPPQPQGESIAVEPPGRSFLIGSEGAGSTLIRQRLNLPNAPSASPRPNRTASRPDDRRPADSDPAARDGLAGATWVWATGALTVLAAIVVVAIRRR